MVVPARAAYSHSASIGRRYARPVLRDGCAIAQPADGVCSARGCGRQNKAWGGAQSAEPQDTASKSIKPADVGGRIKPVVEREARNPRIQRQNPSSPRMRAVE